MNNRRIDLLDKKHCTGCGACYNVCPQNAIKMESDSEGFLMPQIDEAKCTNCGLCHKACPSLTPPHFYDEQTDCYAVMASDEVRADSSSGGMFTLLADYVFEKGGYVFGATYVKDFEVGHILISSKDEIYKLRNSKYVQSDTNTTFTQAKKFLEEGKYVLFSGCPCQIAGLYGYLQKNYDNLLTCDIICHGVPSPYALKKFIEIRKRGREIKDVQFRNKAKLGWSTKTFLEFDDGSEYIGEWNQCTYFNAFLHGLSTRWACGTCQYSKSERVADFTIADFWQIEKYNNAFNDGKGTSLVILNNKKAQDIFEEIKPKTILCESVPLNFAKLYNERLNPTLKPHSQRGEFFKLVDDISFDAAVHLSLEKRYDIVQIGWWFNKNFGGALTNFALNSALESMGYSVIMIDWPKNVYGMPEVSHIRDFAKEHYEIKSINSHEELVSCNELSDTFVVGSDQVWSYNCGPQNHLGFMLDFVNDSKKKISYSSSFGLSFYEGPSEIAKQAAFHLNRFDFVSVRENMGVELCKKYFSVDAERVLDPVFICDPKIYFEEAKKSEINEKEKFLFAYILDPTPIKKQAVEEIAKKKGLKIKVIIDAQYDDQNFYNKNKNTIGADYVLDDPSLNDFLYLLTNASFILTDSFHGACMSIILEKQFAAISNGLRGVPRFETLFGIFPMLKNHWVDDAKQLIGNDEVISTIDFKEAKKVMSDEIKRSIDWLKNAINSPKKHIISTYDILMKNAEENNRRQEERVAIAESSLKKIALNQKENFERELNEYAFKLNEYSNQVCDINNKVNGILASRSYKIGRALTWFPRKVRGLFRRIKRLLQRKNKISK